MSKYLKSVLRLIDGPIICFGRETFDYFGKLVDGRLNCGEINELKEIKRILDLNNAEKTKKIIGICHPSWWQNFSNYFENRVKVVTS